MRVQPPAQFINVDHHADGVMDGRGRGVARHSRSVLLQGLATRNKGFLVGFAAGGSWMSGHTLVVAKLVNQFFFSIF